MKLYNKEQSSHDFKIKVFLKRHLISKDKVLENIQTYVNQFYKFYIVLLAVCDSTDERTNEICYFFPFAHSYAGTSKKKVSGQLLLLLICIACPLEMFPLCQ